MICKYPFKGFGLPATNPDRTQSAEENIINLCAKLIQIGKLLICCGAFILFTDTRVADEFCTEKQTHPGAYKVGTRQFQDSFDGVQETSLSIVDISFSTEIEPY